MAHYAVSDVSTFVAYKIHCFIDLPAGNSCLALYGRLNTQETNKQLTKNIVYSQQLTWN